MKPNIIATLSTQELGDLFPIILEDHNPEWAQHYLHEENLIFGAIGEFIFRIHHIGSTSVPGLVAKPTIDVLVEIGRNSDCGKVVEAMKQCGFLFASKPENPAPHMMFMKGYTEQGFKGQAVHVHVRYPGDWDELYFCEYLRKHPEKQQAYVDVKRSLKARFEHDREAYTNGKSDFIQHLTMLARAEMQPYFSVGQTKSFQQN